MTAGRDTPNPAPPDPDMPRGQQPAGLFRRFIARIVDSAIVYFALAALLYLLRMLTHITIASEFVQFLVAGLLIASATFAYFVVFEVTLGWTPAKKLLRVAVHGPAGAPKPDLKQSAIRNAFVLLWLVPPNVGGVLVLIAWIVIAVTIDRSPAKQGIHDRWAGGTQVVKN